MKLKNWILSVCILSLSAFCREKRPFLRLEPTVQDRGRIYVIRPIDPTLAAWTYEFYLEKYKGHFKKGDLEPISKFDLRNGEYFTDELEDGFYRLRVPSKEGLEKILKIEKGKRSYFRFMIFNEKEISIPDFFIKEVSEMDALENLLEGQHLNEAFSERKP
ncbi:hypothetical protein [Leptospira yasudae]|uniref:Uncharacterized protein n=1 Tax=Leptospira yasudae TaxID=2202201 RepID=A0A6N4QWZ5_9LEPT|nr:hypothetical protein [Leptospira yasudae]TGL78728.1 hypothetical protein EHQ72_09835 [Leptospira yasudae]TGL78977.1 hypothetical protein EHQ77_11320 [Leptospira yasudae]TGL82873.1 hypothetical protein EHQ83_13100 [Leptospira yasudae]